MRQRECIALAGLTLALLILGGSISATPVPRQSKPNFVIIYADDLAPLLTQVGPGPRDTMVFYRGTQLRAIRKGPWKMHLYAKTEYVRGKLKKHVPPLLFHLEHDPGEQYNLSDKHPVIIRELQQEISKHQATLEAVPSQLEKRQT